MHYDAPPRDRAPPVAFQFPMYVLPVGDVLALEFIECHEDVRDKLVEYHEGMGACAFFSHTWLRRASPDSAAGEKCALLKEVLSRCVRGQLSVETELQLYMWTMQSLRVKSSDLKRIKYVWMDFL